MNGIEYDEQGRPFTYIGGTTKRSYISPVAFGHAKPQDDGGGFFRTDLGWNTDNGQWERDWDLRNIALLGVGGIAGAAAAPAIAGAFGGSGAGGGTGAAQGGLLASTPHGAEYSGMLTGLPGGAAAGGAGGILPAVKSLLLSGNAKGALKLLAPLLMGGAAVLGRPRQQGVSPEVQSMLAEAVRRIQAQGPLFDAVNNMAMNSLPKYATQKPGGR